MSRTNIALMALLGALCLPSPSLASPAETLVRTQILMGTVPVTIQLDAHPKHRTEALECLDNAFRVAREIEARVSEFRQDSLTSQLNRLAGIKPVVIDHHLEHLLRRSRDFSQLTDGLFDITYGSKTKSVSYHNVQFDPIKRQAYLEQVGTRIGLSGIAKGYIVDRIAAELRRSGYRRFLINAGGDIWAESPTGDVPWLVGLFNHPEQEVSKFCHVPLRNVAIATSGSYERGEHIIDPHSKRTAPPTTKAITVIASDAETADALATAAYVAGNRVGSLFERLRKWDSEIAVVLTKHDGTLHFMGPWKQLTAEGDLVCGP